MSKKKKKINIIEKRLDEKFRQEFGQRFGNEVIIKENVADANLDYMKIFGANKNLYRTIASLQDGLKPGKRRLLYSWWEYENRPSNTKRETLNKLRFIKVEKISSNTSTYHPHGSSATDDVIGSEGQYWANNIMLLDPQGSYGNMRGDTYAAGRYREARLSEYTIDCFFDDFEKYCVPMKLSYDGENYEPEFLPAKYPHILFNPQYSGIGYGMASNIPSFNVGEVLDATITLIKNPNAKIMLIPDSPTGCDIIDNGLFKDINKTGKAKVTFRATTEIDYADNVIKITSLPLNSTSDGVIQKIIEMKNKGIFDNNSIVEIKDSTKEGEVKIEIFLGKDTKPDKILKKLFKKNTGLKDTMPVGITVIDNYTEYEYGVKDLLLQWIDYRLDVVRSMMLNNLQITLSKKHMNEVLLMVFNKDNIDTTIKIARTSSSRKETVDRYMKQFNISSLQAGVIADMRVYNFNKDSYDNYIKEAKKIDDELEVINGILKDEKTLENFVIEQLKEGKKKWAKPRRSKVVKENDTDNILVPDEDYLIGISESGFIKKLHKESNNSIGYVGNTNGNIYLFDINNREDMLAIDSIGNVIKIPVSTIPEMSFEDVGIELSKFFSVKGDIKAVMELPSVKMLDVKDESFGIIFITKKGLAKRVQLSEFKNIVDTKCGIVLNEDDEVAAAMFSVDNSKKDIIISTNKGNGIRLPLNEIRNNKLGAKGVSMVSLKEGETVVNATLINPKSKLLFYITSLGRAKVTDLKLFPTMNRKDSVLNLISLQGNETLIGVSGVNKNDSVLIYKKKSEPTKIEIKDIDVGTRVSKGNKIIKTGFGDVVVSYKVISN